VPAETGASIRLRGEDLRLGELVMSAGKTLRPADLGMLASVGRAMVEVIRRPRVAIVATGDELVDVDRSPVGAQVAKPAPTRSSSRWRVTTRARFAHGWPRR